MIEIKKFNLSLQILVEYKNKRINAVAHLNIKVFDEVNQCMDLYCKKGSR